MSESSVQVTTRAKKSSGWSDDLQSLLTQAVSRLARMTGCTHVAAWALRPDGTPYVLAATPEAAGPYTACREIIACVLSRPVEGGPRSADLGGPGVSGPVREHAARAGFAAGAPIGAPGEATSILLIGGPRDRVGHVRLTTLSALDATARRLWLTYGHLHAHEPRRPPRFVEAREAVSRSAA